MTIKALTVPLLGAALIGGAITGVGVTAFAQSATPSRTPTSEMARVAMPFAGAGVSGTVSAVSGSTITLTAKDGGIYTIDASGATVTKYANGTTTTVGVSGITVGDVITVNGTIKTANMTAKTIRDGAPAKPAMPVAVGKVTAVNGSTITLSGVVRPMPMMENAPSTTLGEGKLATITYTVDASGATITKITASATKGAKPTTSTITVSQIALGDMLSVQGTANGSAITATAITDTQGFSMGMRGLGKGK